MTLAKQASKTVLINGVSDKIMISKAFTFHWVVISLTVKLTPRTFSPGENPKHLSNEKESIKLRKIIRRRNERKRNRKSTMSEKNLI